MIHQLNKNISILNTYLSEIRNVEVQNDRMRFRENIERISFIMGYELSKHLQFQEEAIQTPLGTANCHLLQQQPVIASILRAALPMHSGLLDVFDKAENAFISAYRKQEQDDFTIKVEYISRPSIQDKVLILADPMLATASSMILAYQELCRHETPKHTHILAILASKQGVENLIKELPQDKVTIWLADIDEELNQHYYIVPGLGDAGDLAFGAKL